MRLIWSVILPVHFLLAASPVQAGTASLLLRYTPWWVFPLFAVLIVMGAREVRSYTTQIWQTSIAPSIFVAWGLWSLIDKMGSHPMLGIDWCAAATGAGALAFAIMRPRLLHVDRARGLVRIGGSWLPLTMNIVVFAAKYVVTAAWTINVEARDQLSVWDVAISGLTSGYFVGWFCRLYAAYSQIEYEGAEEQS